MEDLEFLLKELSEKSLAFVGKDLSSLSYVSIYTTTHKKRIGDRVYTYEYLVGELPDKERHLLKKISPGERREIYELIHLYRACYHLEQARVHLTLFKNYLEVKP